LDSAIPSDAKVEGFTYSGAFFSSQEWAALKERFEREYDWYNNACKIMGTPRSHIDSTKLQHNEIAFPPTDLITMKTFIRTGHPYKRRRKKTRRWNQIQAEVRRMTSLVEKLQSQGRAPRGVILYLEGLDCAGKSSTGGLIFDALEASGYDVNMVQYNRPPTDEEKKRPWMDRFQMPPVDPQESGKVKYSAILWDRGPAGDFVYGNLHQLSDEARVARYEEFMAFDEECRRRRILFCKLLFVADRDSIAETLGKRLSHKRIARDLHTWLDANSSPQEREGLDEIETHIDPSDFVAFNKYDCNLARFCEFVRNTNGVDEHINPWLVVSTYKRHPARLALLKGFERQLMEFAKLLDHPTPAKSVFALPEEIRYKPGGLISPLSSVTDQTRRPLPSGIVEAQEHGISMKAVLLSFLLAFLAYSYANQTLHFSIEDIT
jgi:polyphosphate kinase 2 (PPK2 family)